MYRINPEVFRRLLVIYKRRGNERKRFLGVPDRKNGEEGVGLRGSSQCGGQGPEDHLLAWNGQAHVVMEAELLLRHVQKALKLGMVEKRDRHYESAPLLPNVHREVSLGHVPRQLPGFLPGVLLPEAGAPLQDLLHSFLDGHISRIGSSAALKTEAKESLSTDRSAEERRLEIKVEEIYAERKDLERGSSLRRGESLVEEPAPGLGYIYRSWVDAEHRHVRGQDRPRAIWAVCKEHAGQ
ncbi:unnamed protein product [Victoria cruziana]